MKSNKLIHNLVILLVLILEIITITTASSYSIIRTGDDGDVWKPVPWTHPYWGNPIGDPLAKWTWLTPQVSDPSGGEVHTYERNFYISSTPTPGRLTITCDNGYQAFLNGVEVGIDGLNRSDAPWDTPEKRHDLSMYAWQSAETYDITNKLKQGENKLSIIAVNFADPGDNSYQQNPAGLLYRLEYKQDIPSSSNANQNNIAMETSTNDSSVEESGAVLDKAANAIESQDKKGFEDTLSNETLSMVSGDPDLSIPQASKVANGLREAKVVRQKPDMIVYEMTIDGITSSFYTEKGVDGKWKISGL